MLELIGLVALIYVALKFGSTVIGFIAKGLLALILLIIALPLALFVLNFLLSFAAAFWSALL